MAVYTRITLDELRQAAARFGLTESGNLVEVGDGIENSTYFFTALTAGSRAAFVLTILENTPPEQMRFSAALCAHLAAGGLPVPAPLADAGGNQSLVLAGKNALIFPRAIGKHPVVVTADQCRVMGDYLAKAHRSGETFSPRLANTRGLPWMRRGQQALSPFLSAADSDLLDQQLAAYEALLNGESGLPAGPIHGDLFRDNALFDGNQLSGVIDFYNACTDWLLLDVAITVNDWCAAAQGSTLDMALTTAFLDAYQRIRPFTAAERQAWGTVLAIAATRFWVSRLMGHHVPELLGGEVKTKDPDVFKNLLLNHRQGVPPLPGSAH